MPHKSIFTSLLLSLLALCGPSHAADDSVYLFTFFREPNGVDGLHLAWSRDGYRWTEIGPANHTWVKSSLQDKCMRDPSLAQGPDGTFHLVWTTGWKGKGFGYASSKDLVQWTEPVVVPVFGDKTGVKNTWAPELFYDAKNAQWLIFWSSTIEGAFPETAKAGDNNHRIYYVTTKDFKTFSETKLLLDPGHNCIDATMIQVDGKYHLIYKDERPKFKHLQIVTSDSAQGPWGQPCPPLSKPGNMVEGPTAIQVGNEHFIYFDVYSNGKYGALKSKDLQSWEDVTSKLVFPRQFRHGTVLKVSEAVVRSLQSQVAQRAKLTVDVDKPGVKISATLWGIFFEEINCAGDGGLYAELVRNRSFEDSDKPEHWTLVTGGSAKAQMNIDPQAATGPVNKKSLKLQITDPGTRAAVANGGWWGIAVVKDATYELSLYAKADNFTGPLSISLESVDGKIHAQATIDGIGGQWKQFKATLTSAGTDPKARLVIGAAQPGTIWLDVVSLFPQKTFKNHGMRPDLAQMLQDLRPAFVRFPGGCWVEGNDMSLAMRWKQTIGDIAERRNQWNIWHYWSTNGLGYHEYLQLCEDLGAEPLFVINCGMSHKEVVPMDKMQEFVQDALDAIEYANGPAESKWGALRAKAGHPAPFNLRLVEIGNENGGPAYNERWALFHDAIKAKHPGIQLIANHWGGGVPKSRPIDIVDEHYYSSPEFFIAQANRYDSYDRKGPKVYVGEYAVTQGCGQGNLRGALGEAAFMCGMERNSDIVTHSSYAPLFANVNYKKWNPDLIDFDSSRVYGIPSYYVQKMFAANRGDLVLPVAVESVEIVEQVKTGGVGVGTWATQAEYKDLKVVQGDKVLFESAFADGTKGWKTLHGKWSTQDGVLKQTSGENDVRATTGGRDWADYTYTLKARKTGGAEGFLVMFQVRGDGDWVWWNLGGWSNKRHGLERCEGGGKTELGQGVNGRIETGRWYDIKIELKGQRIRCYLDGKLIHDVSQSATRPLYAAASRDNATGEIILKVINVSSVDQNTQIDLRGPAKVHPTAKATVLTSANPWDENTLDEPTKVAPVEQTITTTAPGFRHLFPANSFTVIRLKPE